VTRPVKELKGFQRLKLKPGESRTVEFVIGPDNIAFYGRDMKLMNEPGDFHVWIGGSSEAELRAEFTVTSD
jgi:beta-glucosidase